MGRNSTPNRRASESKKEVAVVRRRYKVDIRKKRKLLPGEIPHVTDMIVVLRLASYTNVQIARILGISVDQVREFLNTPEVADKLTLMREKLPQAALDLLQGFMIEAVQSIADVMRRSPDDKIVVQAAAEILDRGGLPKASKQERHNINEDSVTITDDGIVDRLREASPEVQEEAAQLIERLEMLLAASVETSDEEAGEDA